MPVIPGNKVVDKNNWKRRAEEEERHKGSLTQMTKSSFGYYIHGYTLNNTYLCVVHLHP
jgi:hypothetical protein